MQRIEKNNKYFQQIGSILASQVDTNKWIIKKGWR